MAHLLKNPIYHNLLFIIFNLFASWQNKKHWKIRLKLACLQNHNTKVNFLFSYITSKCKLPKQICHVCKEAKNTYPTIHSLTLTSIQLSPMLVCTESHACYVQINIYPEQAHIYLSTHTGL
uniref:Uncharacterized protein n=1 Tax=Pyxicephalus adspersus TaxID=30357 RepID=A0AAV3B333_PYXAD|nr:TPA: hypothetical protein GDO54_001477 [Pyxicephalus adspersus]